MYLTDGKRARIIRLGSGLRLIDLAKLSGYSISYLSKMENEVRPVPPIIEIVLKMNQESWLEKLLNVLNEAVGYGITNKKVCITEILNPLKKALNLGDHTNAKNEN